MDRRRSRPCNGSGGGRPVSHSATRRDEVGGPLSPTHLAPAHGSGRPRVRPTRTPRSAVHFNCSWSPGRRPAPSAGLPARVWSEDGRSRHRSRARPQRGSSSVSSSSSVSVAGTSASSRPAVSCGAAPDPGSAAGPLRRPARPGRSPPWSPSVGNAKVKDRSPILYPFFNNLRLSWDAASPNGRWRRRRSTADTGDRGEFPCLLDRLEQHALRIPCQDHPADAGGGPSGPRPPPVPRPEHP